MITFVNSQEQAETSPTSPITMAIDIGTRTNGLLVIGNVFLSSNVFSGLSATYNAVSMGNGTLYEVIAGSGYMQAKFHFLENPSNGNNDYVITYTHTGGGSIFYAYILAAWYDGAHQSSVFGNENGSNGDSSAISTLLTPPEDNCLIQGVYYSESNNVGSIGSGENFLDDYDFGSRVAGGSYVIQGTAGEQDIDWSLSPGDLWIQAVISLKAAAVAGGQPFMQRMQGIPTGPGFKDRPGGWN